VDVSKFPCPVCGAKEYEFGTIEHYEGKSIIETRVRSLSFRNNNQEKPTWGLLDSFRKSQPLEVNQARHCLSCGNIQTFIEKK